MRKKVVAPLLLATSLFTLQGTSFAADNLFTDVDANSPYAPYIQSLKGVGVLHGNPDGSLKPHDHLTRAEFATLLVQAFKLPAAKQQVKFSDSATHWGAAYIASANEAGVIAGTSDTTFSPEEPVTREQAAAMVWRYLQANGVQETKNQFTVAPGYSDYAADAVKNVIGYMMHGPNEVQLKSEGKDYKPQEIMTREQAVALIDLASLYLDQAKLDQLTQEGVKNGGKFSQHAGSQQNPIIPAKGMVVTVKNKDGSVRRVTEVTDILNPTDSPYNIITDGNTMKLGNLPVVHSTVDPNADFWNTNSTAAVQLASKLTITNNGDQGITIHFPSTEGTGLYWKIFDWRQGEKSGITTITTPTLDVPMNQYFYDFLFVLDTDPTPDDERRGVGFIELHYFGEHQYRVQYSTTDIN